MQVLEKLAGASDTLQAKTTVSGDLVRVSIAVVRVRDRKQLGEKGGCFSLQLSGHRPLLKALREGTRGKN